MSGPRWQWVTGTVRGPCAGCGKPLYQDRAAGLVQYDAKNWHVHCVLDKLPEPVPQYYNPYLGMTP